MRARTMLQIKKILAVRNDRFGEFLLTIPALRALKESFKESAITLVVAPLVRELAECVEFVARVKEWDNQKSSILKRLRFANELRGEGFDLCVIFNPTSDFHQISFLAGIPFRLGYNRKSGFLLTQRIDDKKHLGQKHEIEYNLELVRACGADTKDLFLSLRVDEVAANSLQKKLNLDFSKKVIAIHPWTSDKRKQWPLQRFRALADEMSRGFGCEVIIIGGKEHAQESAKHFASLRGHALDLTGSTSLTELAALLKRCSLVVSGDSGPMHLAACVGTPVVALFRSDLAGKTSRRWGPWGKGHTLIEKESLSEISVEEVLCKIKEYTALWNTH